MINPKHGLYLLMGFLAVLLLGDTALASSSSGQNGVWPSAASHNGFFDTVSGMGLMRVTSDPPKTFDDFLKENQQQEAKSHAVEYVGFAVLIAVALLGWWWRRQR